MIPGFVSKMSEATVASAATVTAKADIVTLTGTTQVNTINPGLGTAVSQFLILITTGAGVVLGTSGNILVGATVTTNRALYLTWVKSLQKWVIGL
jgi:hypothetical protein